MIVEILRHKKNESESYYQKFEYHCEDENETVATMLNNLNLKEDLKDLEGNSAERISFRQSCLQKKCGACAMRINGKPSLACDRRVRELGDHVVLEPLKKFPVVEDLIVDRTAMSKNLKKMEVYLKDEAIVNEKRNELSYEASRCLQCGLCLEVCPNFMIDNGFTGMAGGIPASRIINESARKDLKDISKAYSRNVYEGCGKSLSCVDICPAGIKIEDLLVNSNAIAVWKRFLKD